MPEVGKRSKAETPGRQRGILSFIVLLVVFFSCFQPPSVFPQDKGEESESERAARIYQERKDRRLLEIQRAFDEGEDKEAAGLLYEFYRRYRDDEEAEDALWRSLELQRDQAWQAEEPDWDALKDRYRLFVREFPSSARVPRAYFETGRAFFSKHYFREALTYFKLYGNRFPAGPEREEAMFMRARCLISLDKLSEAVGVYAELAKSKDKVYRLRGRAGEGHIFFARKDYHSALGVYTSLLRHNPEFYVHDPEVLRRMGMAYLETGNEEEGRKSLFGYLNLVGKSSSRVGDLFEIAESYLRQEKNEPARQVYLRVLDEAKEGSREMTMSEFRLAQLRAAFEQKLSEQEKKELLARRKDHPFQAVLDRYYSDEIAQDARYFLLLRLWSRQEHDKAYDLGKPYLRYKNDPDKAAEVRDIMGRILVRRCEKLLEKQEYRKVYELYRNEYKYLKEYKKGRLLYLVGRAFEGLALYKQAAVVYYRALALELEDQEKIDLYLRRAEVYLIMDDLRAAQRLLKYLRDIYRENKVIGEIYWLSGRLREVQDRPGDAVSFYKMAVAEPAVSGKKSVYAEDYLRLLLQRHEIAEVKKVLAWFSRDGYLEPAGLQKWYGRLGDQLREEGDQDGAAKAYGAALAQGMPDDNEIAQSINLHYGDILLDMKDKDTARACFERASRGRDQLLKKMAAGRLAELDIDKRMEGVK